MNKIFIALLIFASFDFSSAQSRYFVYFKDKEINSAEHLDKSSESFAIIRNTLSQRSIERRIKNMGEENYITYEDYPINSEYVHELEKLGIQIFRKLKWFNAVSCYLSDEQIKMLGGLPFVSKVEQVKSYKYVDNEKYFSKYTNFEIIQDDNFSFDSLDYGYSSTQNSLVEVPQIHGMGIDASGVVIGLLDSGFNWRNNPATKNINVLAEYDFVFNDSVTSNEAGDPVSEHNHGTSVLSVIGGYAPGDLIGPAYGASYILAKTEYVASEKHVEEDNYAAALEWMDSIGVDIVSSSVGYSLFDAGETSYTYEDMNGQTTIVTRASELAFERGIVCITSAGNEGNDPWYYISAPADGFNTIAVGAVNKDNQLASFSSHGPTYDGRIKPDVVAQGVSVFCAITTSGEYEFANGTSFSAPMVSGIAGLLLSTFPYLTNVQIRKILIESGDNVQTPDNDRGYGLVSAVRAITFPNLSSTGSGYTLHKIFINPNEINPENIRIHYGINSSGQITEELNFGDGYRYTYDFLSFTPGDSINFYFTYNDAFGNSVRIPENKNYIFRYGDLIISLNSQIEAVPILPSEYLLMQNFPNPFNSRTEIRFVSKDATFSKLVIFNSLGEKVRDLFEGQLNIGTNFVIWNGLDNSGRQCSSGPYFYILSVGGQIFSKKMILLK